MLWSEILRAGMTLGRRYDDRKFRADAILYGESSGRTMLF